MPEVHIVDYEVRFASHFASLNYQWITEYFRVEEEDRKALDDPEGYAIKPGGNIFFLLEDETPVGTVAMVPITRSEDREELCFELAKMAVRPDRRGKGYGSMLMQHSGKNHRGFACTPGDNLSAKTVSHQKIQNHRYHLNFLSCQLT